MKQISGSSKLSAVLPSRKSATFLLVYLHSKNFYDLSFKLVWSNFRGYNWLLLHIKMFNLRQITAFVGGKMKFKFWLKGTDGASDTLRIPFLVFFVYPIIIDFNYSNKFKYNLTKHYLVINCSLNIQSHYLLFMDSNV